MAGSLPIYGPEIREAILERLEAGETLRGICSTSGYPDASTVVKWGADDPEWEQRYARARHSGFDSMAEGLLTIAADSERDPNCRKVEIDARRWYLSKLRPDVYGDRTALQMLDEHGKPARAGITIIVDGSPE